jgi:uncharacterized protein (TIGR02266 family)
MSAAALATVLVDADAALALEFATTFLRRTEVRVLFSGSREEALRLASEERPDLILLDVDASNRRGLDICQALKSAPALAAIPVVILCTLGLKAAAEAAGADAVLFRPLVQRELLAVVQRFLRVQSRERARYRVSLRFSVTAEGSELALYSHDLSVTGVFLRSEKLPSRGTRVALRFSLPDEAGEILCDGIVRSIRRPGAGQGDQLGFGVQFLALQDGDRARIRRFVEAGLRPPSAPDR